MRSLIIILFFVVFVSKLSVGQETYLIREDSELNKEFLFEFQKDSIFYCLSFVQTEIVYSNKILANFEFIEKNLKTSRSDTIIGKVSCLRIDDILESDSLGYVYNPKSCLCTSNGIEYLIEFEETETDYKTAHFVIFEIAERKITKKVDLLRILK